MCYDKRWSYCDSCGLVHPENESCPDESERKEYERLEREWEEDEDERMEWERECEERGICPNCECLLYEEDIEDEDEEMCCCRLNEYDDDDYDDDDDDDYDNE